ncbi:MAG: hypothetical protein SFV54_27915 [Bryobacteraceae bacterium]|nr:hypothetical protein [Bryobacteraceae bacterium]
MPDLPTFLTLLGFLQLAAQAILIIHLLRTRLSAVYPSFLFLVCASSLREAALLALYSHPSLYATLYVATAPVTWLSYILAALELYGKVLKGYPGISSVARWLLIAVAPVSIVASLLLLLPEMDQTSRRFFWLMAESMITRGVCASILVFLLLLTVFLVWYPVPMNRNTVRHAFLLSTLFVVQTAALLLRDAHGYDLNRIVSVVLAVFGVMIVATWLLLLQPAGEILQVVVRTPFNQDDERRLLEQLSALNASLSPPGRK